MNAKQASLLLPGEVVMMNNNSKWPGTVKGFDPINGRVSIYWSYAKRISWYEYDKMFLVEKWQPDENKIMEETMIAQMEREMKMITEMNTFTENDNATPELLECSYCHRMRRAAAIVMRPIWKNGEMIELPFCVDAWCASSYQSGCEG